MHNNLRKNIFISFMEIAKNLEIVDLGLYVPEKNLLIMSDIHLGYESELNRKGVLLPRFQYKEMIERIGKILLQTEPETIIITGDLKHEFGHISEQEWRDALRFIDFLHKTAKKIILIKGNHDTILGPIARKREVELVDHYLLSLGKNKVYICHGDAMPDNNAFSSADTVIIGHEHPAVTIEDGIRQEKYKCFLVGKWKNKSLIVLPSVNLVHEGTEVKKEKLLSPFLQGNLSNFDVYVVGGAETLHFGKLKNI